MELTPKQLHVLRTVQQLTQEQPGFPAQDRDIALRTGLEIMVAQGILKQLEHLHLVRLLHQNGDGQYNNYAFLEPEGAAALFEAAEQQENELSLNELHRKDLVVIMQRKLRILEVQQVQYGQLDCPPRITMEIEDLRRELASSESRSSLQVDEGVVDTSPTSSAASSFRSGGLGLSREDWEDRHGSPTDSLSGLFTYEAGKYVVSFLDSNASYIERSWQGKERPTLDEARDEMKHLFPEDTIWSTTYRAPEYRAYDLHRSTSLINRFQPFHQIKTLELSTWLYSEPGMFLALYRVYDGKVSSAILALGNNP